MSYIVHQKNKKTGVTYVYEARSYWDKEKKQPRNKQVCIGKLDSKTGEFIPSKRLNPKQAAARDPEVTATSRIIGPTLVLKETAQEIGLAKVLKTAFPKSHQQILTMAYYLACSGNALSHCGAWARGHDHPADSSLSSQRITEVIQSIRPDGIQSFFKKWGGKLLENDYLYYDITSVSSYSRLNEFVKYGYNRDGERLPQINLALLSGKNSQLPVYYRSMPGNITDVSTLKHFLKTMKYQGFGQLHLVLDKGFYSRKNIDSMLKARNKFTIAVPMRNKWLQQIIDEVSDTIQGPESYCQIDDEILYVNTRLFPWGEKRRRCYLHLYYNSYNAAKETDDFNKQLFACRDELESGNLVTRHEELYERYFIIKETPARGKKVLFNNEAIQKYRKRYTGFYAILSNGFKDPVKALRIYRDKDSVEKCFDNLKNQLDMKRLRIHSSATMEGRLFVQFIALILMSALRRKMRSTGLSEQYTVRGLLQEMETLTRVNYSGKYGHIITETSKTQRNILQKLEINSIT